MIWNVAAPFLRKENIAGGRWIDDFVPGTQHKFRKIPFAASGSANWHQRATRGTPIKGWIEYWQTAKAALTDADGIITVFPQLATAIAARQRMNGRTRVPIVAWCFNIGQFPGGPKRALAQAALRDVERFVVHSTGEIDLISQYLDIDRNRVRFVPLQRPVIDIEEAEEEHSPFILSMGSANRDYATLMVAAKISKLPVTVVASPRSTAGLSIPDNVRLLSDLDISACRKLAQRARLSVVPIANVAAASGQITVLEAMGMRRPVIATRSIGTTDYVRDGETGRLVSANDAEELSRTMVELWQDAAQRERLASAGRKYAHEELSDQAAGRALEEILNEFT